MANTNVCKECNSNVVYTKGLCRNCYSRREYNKKAFLNYVMRNYKIDTLTEQMLQNMLSFIGESYTDKTKQCEALCELLHDTIGLSDAEIRKVYM